LADSACWDEGYGTLLKTIDIAVGQFALLFELLVNEAYRLLWGCTADELSGAGIYPLDSIGVI
jgi:hypothetical protein